MNTHTHYSSLPRRQFIRQGTLASIGAALLTRAPSAIAAEATVLSPIEYGRSFLSGKLPGNRVRFWVESRTRIIDERAGSHQDFYQCASCKAESTFAKEKLFAPDNYDFTPIFGPVEGVINPANKRIAVCAGIV